MKDGGVLVFGVDLEAEETSTGVVYQFNNDQDTWEFVADGGLPRFGTNMVLLADGRVLIAGGVDPGDDDSGWGVDISPEVEVFNPTTRTWATSAAMPQTGEGQALVLLQDGRVLAVHRDFSKDGLRGALLYDPRTDSWVFTGERAGIGDFPKAVTLEDGRVQVTTTAAYKRGEPAWSRLYEPASDSWEKDDAWGGLITRVLDCPRTNHSVTLLPEGRVLVSGGGDFFDGDVSDDRRGTTEILDPETGEWTWGPLLQELCSNHTATLLSDGRVLLTGGIGLVIAKDEIAPTFTIEFIEP